MRIRRIDHERFQDAYGILCQGVLPWEGTADTPFSTTWCVVGPGKVARAHRHQEHEAFFIARGRGLMRVDDESREVGPGDAILMEPFSLHELRNLSDEEDLVFLDVLWENLSQAARSNDERLAAAAGELGRPTLITSTPPTPNGDLHVGHLAGPYLSADVYRRYLALRGVEARHVTGVDDHQSYVEVKAGQLGTTPETVARRFGDVMEESLAGTGVEVDHFARPRRSRHHTEMVRELFTRLYEQGDLVTRTAPTLFCEPCGRFLFEAHVQGQCGRCGAGSDGNVCEACGWPNDCVDLVQPQCRYCGGTPVEKPCRRLYFPLAPWADRLAEYHDRVRMGAHLRALCDDMLARGLPDIAVSQVGSWGIPVPLEGFEDQRIYVWFEMAPGYLAATRELAEAMGEEGGWERFWAAGDRRVVQFFGFDNGYFHAVLFPAVFMAYDSAIRLPDAFVTNEFYRYEGTKFSTSRSHALWGHELLERVPVDQARFYLAWDRPDTEQRDFRLAELWETVEQELAGAWDPWLRGLGGTLRDHFSGAVPGTGAWTEEHQSYYRGLLLTIEEVGEAYGVPGFSPPRAARLLCELVRRARRAAAADAHWAGLPGRYEEWRTAIALQVLTAKVLAMLAAPILPEFAARLWRELGLGEEGPGFGAWECEPEFVAAGTVVGGMEEPYFPSPDGDSSERASLAVEAS